MPSGLAAGEFPFAGVQGEAPQFDGEYSPVMLIESLPATGEGSPPPETMSVREALVPTG